MLSIVVHAAYGGALAPQQKAKADARMTPAKGQRLLASHSARFIENKGQWDSRAKFLARSSNLDLWFTDQGIRYDQYTMGKGGKSQAVDMSFVGGAKIAPQGRKKLRARIDYFLPGMSAQNVGAYGELLTQGVVPGVAMRSYFDSERPRYDLLVAPGADARTVKLRFKGGNGLSVSRGELRIATKLGGFANGKPLAYQLVNGKRISVTSRWRVLDASTAGFEIGAYDHRKPLVIDPLIFGTYFGGNTGADEVRAAVADADKNVYFTGSTRDARFPVLNPGFPSTGDSSGLNINNGSGPGQSDAFVSRISGDAYSYDYSAFFGGSLDDFGQFIKFDPSGNIWIAGTTGSSDFPLNDRGNVQYLFSNGPDVPNGDAQFRLRYRGAATVALPYNATTTEVANALEGLLGAGSVRSVTSNGGTLPFATYRIELAPNLPFAITVDSSLVQFGTNDPVSQGLSLIYRAFSVKTDPNPAVQRPNPPLIQDIRAFGSNDLTPGAPFGNYTLSFTDQTANPQTQTTRTIVPRTTGDVVASELNRLTNLGTNIQARGTVPPFGDVSKDPEPTLPGRFAYSIAFFDTSQTPATVVPENLLVVNSTNLRPRCTYGTRSVTDIFVLHLNRNANGSLTPSTDPVKIYGSDDNDELTGFDVWQNSVSTLGAGKVEFALAGTTTARLKNIQANAALPITSETGFVLRQTWSASESYREVPISLSATDEPAQSLPYVRSRNNIPTDVHGVAFDSDGSFYVAGNLGASSNITTGVNSLDFVTTSGIYSGGNNIRNKDVFVRKYLFSGAIAISGILGGEGDDSAGGIGADLDGSRVNTGSAIAVDQFHNIYVTGVSRSFNFPRTLNVFGPIRTNVTDIFVTKIDSTGSNILYSTMLNTNPGGRYLGNTVVTGPNLFSPYSICEPAGIAVDLRGYAYITGNLRPNEIIFPNPTAGDPNQPSSSTYPSISLAGAPDSTYDGPTGSEYPTIESFVTVLNPTATGLSLSTYQGGFLDDFTYGPSITPYGDVFSVGWTDSLRGYTRVSSTGTPTNYITGGNFPLITNLAVKQGGDQSGGALGLTVGYGLWGTFGVTSPTFVQANYSRDGFITQYRIDAASVSSLTFTPTSIPGGLGAFTTGTVTLSQAVGSGGGQIVISLPNGTGSASLQDPSTNPDANSITVDVPQGATSATFRVYSKAVTSNTSVTVRATFEGTFKEAAFQVVPWLQRLQLSQDSIVGGDPKLLRGTVTLSSPAPVGGAQVVLSIQRVVPNGQPAPARVVNVPFTVPEGQTSAQFDIDTDGVDANVDVLVSASLLGVTKTATFTITPARLQSITITPSLIASGGKATAIVTLNGKAPTGGYAVNLTSSDPSVTITPATVVIPAQSVSSVGQTITISTTQATNGSVTITATHGTLSTSAVLQVQQVEVASFKLDPSTVESGETSKGTITLKADAPAGGAKVYITGGDFDKVTLSDANGYLKKDNGVFYTTVGGGKDTTEISVTAGYFGTTQTVDFNVGGLTQTLTIKPITFSLSLDPNPVIGGSSVTGTITIANPATINLNFAVSIPSGGVTSSINFPVISAGETSTTVLLSTPKVAGPTTVPITLRFKDGVVTKTLTINPIGILRIVPLKKIVRGSSSAVVNLDVYFGGARADLPDDGLITFTSSQPSIVPSRTYRVRDLRGSSAATLFIGRAQLPARRVSKSQDVTITASYAGTTASTVVTVTR